MNWKAIFIIFLSLIVTETTFATDKKKKITISGYVKDSNGKPLQCVSIIIDETTLNKVTDKKGFYKIKVNPDIRTITVYSVYNGGADFEFTGKTKISFILAANDSDNPKFSNSEELIDVGYSTEKKSKTSNGSSTI